MGEWDQMAEYVSRLDMVMKPNSESWEILLLAVMEVVMAPFLGPSSSSSREGSPSIFHSFICFDVVTCSASSVIFVLAPLLPSVRRSK